jgi:UDP-GlcNAc:undecaprenyl-phosphate GlcNAc-1-phosphate transferase
MSSFLDVLRHYQYFGLLAFCATVFLTPLAIRAAFRFNVLDIPDQVLKPHAKPIPYLGGTAICAAWALALIGAMLSGAVTDLWTMIPLLVGGVAMSMLGLIDDIRNIPPRIRLLAGTIIITCVILTTGVGLRLFDSFIVGLLAVLHDAGIDMPHAVVDTIRPIGTALSVALSVFVVLGACNSANLIDGLDGLCSGVTAIISLGFFLLAAHLAMFTYSPAGDPVRLALAIAMFGAALGFLPWNFNPAKIFMGDAGSVLLGYNCGMLILLFAEQSKFRWVVGALMIFALPVFDTALAMFRRWRAGRSIFEGDRSHFYDQLKQRGLSVRQTVTVCYLLTCLYAGIGLLLTWLDHGRPVIRTRWAVLLYLGVVALTALIAWMTGLTNPESRSNAHKKAESS